MKPVNPVLDPETVFINVATGDIGGSPAYGFIKWPNAVWAKLVDKSGLAILSFYSLDLGIDNRGRVRRISIWQR